MNKKDRFTYKMIEATVSKGLKYIEENGNRGVRYFIDLGEHFAKGKSQKLFFEAARTLLNDDKSKYYAIVQKTIKTVDHRILKKFGINLGYNSLTYGTKLIRENEEVFGQKIPWSIIFDFEDAEYTINNTDLSEFLHISESLGIYCCHFFAGNNTKALNEVLPVLKEHEDSSYFIFLKPESLSDEMINLIADAGNMAAVLLYEPGNDHTAYINVSQKLHSKKCMYGIYSLYDEASTHEHLNHASLTEYQKSCSTFAYFVCREKIRKAVNNQLSDHIKLINNQNEYHMHFIDFCEQIYYMDNIVSSENTIILIDGEGQVYTSLNSNLEDTYLNIKTHNALEILEQVNESKDN